MPPMLKTISGVIACIAAPIALALCGPGQAEAGPAIPPTFACTSPSPVEAAICRDPTLAAADRRMTILYQLAKPGPLNRGSNQLAVQRRWLKDRDAHCTSSAWRGTKSLRDCLTDAYSQRIEALAVADLLVDPRLSLAELRLVAGRSEPYFEAIVNYATIDDPAERARAVAAKLAPLYATLLRGNAENLAYAWKKAGTASDAAASDTGFGQFFDVSATFNDDIALTWPCAALIKRPGLVSALGGMWGGAIDSQIPDSDCRDALPAPAELAMLTRLAFDAQPPCDFTIRFSTGRDYAMLEDAVRLHRRDVWRSQKVEATAEAKTFEHERAAVLNRTASALAAYYQRHWSVPSAQAVVDGRAATDGLVNAAFGYCP